MTEKAVGVWANPDDFKISFRCTTSIFADAFLEEGSIKFNTPNSWVDSFFKYGAGRGDHLEGTMALCHRTDDNKVEELYLKYQGPDLYLVNYGERYFFKSIRSLGLPCFCFYIMKNSSLDCPTEEGLQTMDANISATYFRDFMDNKTPEEIDLLSDDEKPALIIINNFDEFRKRIKAYLYSIGLDESEIIITRVMYFDFDENGETGWWVCEKKCPKELAAKDKLFKEQSEARIIINTDKIDIKKRLIENPVEIGSMKDIATVYKGYLYDGMRIEVEGNTILARDDLFKKD